MLAAESSVDSVTADVAHMKVSEPSPPPSKPAADTSTSGSTSTSSAAFNKHDDMEHEEETAEERAKREAELSRIYADLAKEDDRCQAHLYCHCTSCAFCHTACRDAAHMLFCASLSGTNVHQSSPSSCVVHCSTKLFTVLLVLVQGAHEHCLHRSC